jgi:hypothetical protein
MQMKKIVVLLAVLALLPLSQAAAQSGGTFDVFSFDLGFLQYYEPSTGVSGSNETLFGFNVKLSDNISAGFYTFYMSAGTSNVLSLKYQLLEQVRGVLSVGRESIANQSLAGLGFEFIPLTRKHGSSFSTEFKLLAEYLIIGADLDKARLYLGLAMGVGV